MPAEQMVLPFGYKFAEDRASLLIAINTAGLRRLDRAFLLMVHDITRNDWLHKSYNELAEKLNVSYSTARRCVTRCADAGLLTVREERYRTGGQRDNAYAIDWDGVRAHCFNATLTEGPAAHGEQAPAHFEHPPAHPEQAPAQTEHPYKEYIPPSSTKDPPPPKKGRGGGGSSGEWKEIRERLESLGMVDAVGAIRSAQDRELSPSQVGELISEWKSLRPAWDIGGLYSRMLRGEFPPKSDEYVAQQRRAADEHRRSEERAKLAKIRQETAVDAEKLQLLEVRAGPILDAMDCYELEQLVDRVYPEPWMREFFNGDRTSPLVRPDLLREIAQTLQDART